MCLSVKRFLHISTRKTPESLEIFTTYVKNPKQHMLDLGLGHRSPAVTEIYAERDSGIAVKVMGEIG